MALQLPRTSDAIPHFLQYHPLFHSEWKCASNCKCHNCRSLIAALDRDVLVGPAVIICRSATVAHRSFLCHRQRTEAFIATPQVPPLAIQKKKKKKLHLPPPLAETRSGTPARATWKEEEEAPVGPAGDRNGRRGRGGGASEKERGCDCQQHVAAITASRFLTCSLPNPVSLTYLC